MKKVAFGVGKLLTSEELNARFGDLAGGSILSGFRLAPGSSSYLVSLVRDSAQGMKAILPGGTKVEETGDALDVVAVRPNLASANRIDVLYLTYTHERGKTFDYELVEGVAGLPLDIVEHDKKLAIGYITVRPRQAVVSTDLTSLPIGLKKIGRFGETIKQVLFTTTDNQTVINFEHDFLVGQNRVALTIGGVKQFFGKDYDETSTRQLTMKEPLPGGLAGEALISTSTKVFAEDFKKETDAAKQATLDAVNAAKAALDAKVTAYTEMKTPVANLAAIASTYPTAVDGSEVQTLDDGKIYRKEKGAWVYRKELTPGPYIELDARLNGVKQQFTDVNAALEVRRLYVSVEEFPRLSPEISDDPRVQRAIDSLPSAGGTVFFPNKTLTYKATVTISNKGKVKLMGNGFSSIQQAAGTSEAQITFPIFTVSNSGSSKFLCSGMLFQAFETNIGACAIKTVGALVDVVIEKCWFTQTGRAVDGEFITLKFVDNTIELMKYGGLVCESQNFRKVIINNNQFFGVNGGMINLKNTGVNRTMHNISIVGNGFDQGLASNYIATGQNSIGSAIRLENVDLFTIIGNHFNGYTPASNGQSEVKQTGHAIRLLNCNDFEIGKNTYSKYNGSAVYAENCKDFSVDGMAEGMTADAYVFLTSNDFETNGKARSSKTGGYVKDCSNFVVRGQYRDNSEAGLVIENSKFGEVTSKIRDNNVGAILNTYGVFIKGTSSRIRVINSDVHNSLSGSGGHDANVVFASTTSNCRISNTNLFPFKTNAYINNGTNNVIDTNNITT